MQCTMDAPEDSGEALTPLHPNYVKVVRLGTLLFALPFAIGALVLELIHVFPTGCSSCRSCSSRCG
jgi:hypothetical protein